MNELPKEIKIIIKLTPAGGIVPAHVTVKVDDEPIGCIQDIMFHAKADSIDCDFEIIFPDLHSEKIDKSYYTSCNLVDSCDDSINKFKQMLGVKVHLKDIFEGEK